MKIKYVKGNLLDAVEPFILHGVNCQGVMGAGVALAIRNKFPSAYESYMNSFRDGSLRLGSMSGSKQANGQIILNAATQQYCGRLQGAVYTSYAAIEKIMHAVNRSCINQSVAMPKIGAGLGGGDWEAISEIIETASTNFYPVVYCLEG